MIYFILKGGCCKFIFLQFHKKCLLHFRRRTCYISQWIQFKLIVNDCSFEQNEALFSANAIEFLGEYFEIKRPLLVNLLQGVLLKSLKDR